MDNARSREVGKWEEEEEEIKVLKETVKGVQEKVMQSRSSRCEHTTRIWPFTREEYYEQGLGGRKCQRGCCPGGAMTAYNLLL